jgi:hypothetical protein
VTWTIVSSLLGVAIIVSGLLDVFLTLVHPHSRGRLTRAIFAGVWQLTARLGRRARASAGPIAAITVLVSWAATQAVGWALVYLPHVPDGFFYIEGVDPADYENFFEALYFSLVSLSTLGFGEVVPVDPLIRALSPVQAVTGFALLTAGATWLLQLFPTLGRRRATALSLSLLGRAQYVERIPEMDAAAAATVVHGVAQQIAVVRVDLSQHPESYYFREGEAPTSLGHALPIAVGLAAAASESTHVELSTAGAVLDDALEDLGACLRDNFSARGESRSELIDSFARDHS